jgi:aspartyl-tRNA(Asn)/glutamyl-tRNA(Gln) amidotransferase subunit B
MQEGSFRCDANVSVRRAGEPALGTRCEIKNLNSFRFMEQAIEFEARRQVELLEEGRSVAQETRLFDPERNETRAMRTKEDAQDYRYFPDPDLLPLVVDASWIEEVRKAMPELPEARRARYIRDYRLSAYDAAVLTMNQDIGEYFESVVLHSLRDRESLDGADAKVCANWVINDVAAKINAENLPPRKFGVGADTLGRLLRRHREGVIGARTAKDLFSEFWDAARGSNYETQGGHPERVDELIASRGLAQLSDAGAIEALVDEALAANARQVAEYRAGKEKALNSLVGQVMKRSRGKANPAQVNEILRRKLAG